MLHMRDRIVSLELERLPCSNHITSTNGISIPVVQFFVTFGVEFQYHHHPLLNTRDRPILDGHVVVFGIYSVVSYCTLCAAVPSFVPFLSRRRQAVLPQPCRSTKQKLAHPVCSVSPAREGGRHTQLLLCLPYPLVMPSPVHAVN